MDQLKRGDDPRLVMPRHRERGPKRYEYTIETVSAVTGLKLTTLRSYQGNLLQLADFRATCQFVARYLQRQWERVNPLRPALTDVEVFELAGFSEVEQARWMARWPLWQVYPCRRYPEKHQGLQPGACEHCGDPIGVRLDNERYFSIRVGDRWVRYHRLVLPTTPEMQVHHRDLNKWNNRVENLEALTSEEHMARHQSTAGIPPKPGT